MNRLFLYSIITVLFLNVSYGQRLPVQSFSTRDGLASNMVTEIFQDSKGYLWIGTDEGFSIFDGDKFKNIRFDNSTVFGYVNQFCESRTEKNVMWIATNGGGLVRYSDGESTVYSLGDDPRSNSINSLIQDDDGSLWCATDAGLFHFTGGPSEQLTAALMNTYTKFTKGRDGTIWCFDDKSLSVFSPRERKLLTPDVPGLPTDSITHVSALADSSVAIHVFGKKNAVVYIVRKNVITKRFELETKFALFTVLDANGQYWIGSSNGLYLVRNSDAHPFFSNYTTANGLPINDLTIGYQDREQNIWFGSFGRGLTKLETQRSIQYSFPGMSGKGTTDAAGHVWIPSSLGLYELCQDSSGQWNRFLHSIKNNNETLVPVSVVVDSQQHLWVTASDGALYYYMVSRSGPSPSSLKQKYVLSEANGFPRALVITLLIDSKNILWYCLHNGGLIGVDFSHTPRIIAQWRYPYQTMLRDVRALYEDRSGNIWAMGFEPENRVIKRTSNGYRLDSTDAALLSLPRVPFRAVLHTADSTLWFGSRYNGIYFLRNGTWRHLTTSDGLISNQIGSFAETPSGGILIGTQAGMMLMPNYTVYHFTPLQQYVQSPVHTLYSDRRMSFAITNFELSVFDIPSDTIVSSFPQVLFTSIAVNGKVRTVTKEVDLSADENTLSIDFTAISFRNSGALRFQYKLEPLEQDWNPVTANRSVTYANLSPGNYIFAVRSLNQKGDPNEIPSILSITIASPFWMRWWFIGLIIMSVIALLVTLERLRVRRLLEIEKIRSRIAADLHDDIGSGLTRIALLSDMIHRQAQSGERQGDPQFSILSLTNKVGEISRELVDAMSDVVWSIDPRNSSMERLIHRVQTFAVEVCEAKEIDLQLSFGNDVVKQKVGSDSIRAVLLVAKEALTNVVRHSGAQHVKASIRSVQHYLIIEIADDGKGFEMSELSRMNGLTNMRVRIEKNGGVFTVNSSKGSGTTVLATIPLH